MSSLCATCVVMLVLCCTNVLGQELRHELYVDSLDCGEDAARYPKNSTEERNVVTEWLTDNDLKVSFWQSENSDLTIRRSGSGAVLADKELVLSLQEDRSVYLPGQPFMACEWPAKVTFIIHDIPRANYSVKVAGSKSRVANVVGG